jgi:hypothetical protein
MELFQSPIMQRLVHSLSKRMEGVRRVPNLLRYSDVRELYSVCCTVAVESVEDLQVSQDLALFMQLVCI